MRGRSIVVPVCPAALTSLSSDDRLEFYQGNYCMYQYNLGILHT